MTKDEKNYIDQQKAWISAQEVILAQQKSCIDYSFREIELHKAAIKAAKNLEKHYQKGISDAKVTLKKYIEGLK